MRTWVDRGGTFTDVITWRPGAPPTLRKVRSDRAIVGRLALGQLVFGTTVATNALLERQGVRTALLVSAGFADILHIRHMARPALFRPDEAWPEPLAEAVFEIGGRQDPDGSSREALDLSALPDLSAFDAVAIVLLHSHASPAHELQVESALRAAQPKLHISLGHRILPEVGYLARIETTLVDAAITPVLAASITRDRIPDAARGIRSDGGLVPAHQLIAPDAILSGPAGGVLAVAAVARQAGVPGAVGLDMGGTSTDVCCVMGDVLPRRVGEVRVAGTSLSRDMLEVETIAAGGGSVLWHDGVRLRVGPRSAGASPGPQCYGQGGPPTVTDAALLCGLIDADAFDPPLQPARVDLPGDAEAFLEVTREAMAAAIRRIATARGVDLRPLALVAYGGAAGQHAAAVAERLGMGVVLVHPFAAALSAWGQTLARDEAARVQAVWRPLREVWAEIPARLARLEAELPTDWEVERVVEVRPAGTDHPLAMDWQTDRDAFVEAFHRAHRHHYGFERREAALEVVNLRVRARSPAIEVPSPPDDPWALGDRVVQGPRRLDCPSTSVWVPEGWRARRLDGLLRLEQITPSPPSTAITRTPGGVSLWASRFMAVAEQAGETLARLARSVNIRERRDFSCAVFDTEGHLVANAPHIPVHLGAMGQTVRDLLAHEPSLPDGSAWLTNAPAAGGSHLPDLTVVTPVLMDGHRFFVASRGHHVDVGGLTPGSMPPHSTRLADEGLVFRRLSLLQDGRMRTDLADHLEASRQPEVVCADLEAQVAANQLAARLLRELGPAPVLTAWMAHLQDVAEDAVRRLLPRLPAGQATDTLDGLTLAVRCHVEDGLLHVDFTGTEGPHPGNLNAPPAVLRAALLYALRVLVADDIPLNEGALRPVRLVVPSPSVLAPSPEAAVVGGNVETSQRLVDLLFRAWGVRASSAGTMNNLTCGGEGWSHYETIGGGQGGTPHGPGVSGLQVHMTNTRITDPEVLELRTPLRLEAFRLRRASGGAGRHAGGDGLVRQLRVCAPTEVALLATRRHVGAPGLAGGGAGTPGRDALQRGGRWHAWDGHATHLEPGDAVRVETPGGGGWGSTEGDDATWGLLGQDDP